MGEFNNYAEMLDFHNFVELFIKKGTRVEFEKNELFCRIGDRSPFIGYIEKGAFRYTHDSSDGKEHILSYAFENDFFGNYSSYQNKYRSIFNIQAIQKSVIYRLSVSDINSYFNSSMEAQYFGRRLSEVILFSIEQRVISMYCDTAEERYLKLTERCPDILNRITLKELASYIMVTPETLSRIRRKVLSKEKS